MHKFKCQAILKDFFLICCDIFHVFVIENTRKSYHKKEKRILIYQHDKLIPGIELLPKILICSHMQVPFLSVLSYFLSTQ